MPHLRVFVAIALLLFAGVALTTGQGRDPGDALARIKAEGLERSRALALYRVLTDEIGARLTGSPAHVQAARWASDRFAEWGLANPHLEPFEFGRGWQLDHISVVMTEPRYMPLIAYADAWSPGLTGAVTGRTVYIGAKSAEQLDAMAGQLRGAIVLSHLPRGEFVERDRRQPGLDDRPVATGSPTLPGARRSPSVNDLTMVLKKLGVAAALRPSGYRDGTVGVTGNRETPTDAVPTIVVAGEQYNVLARL